MSIHIKNRSTVIAALREELVGPSPQGEPVETSSCMRFDDEKLLYRPCRQLSTGEEILQRDPPIKRYGVGVLYPVGCIIAEAEATSGPLEPPDMQREEAPEEGAPEITQPTEVVDGPPPDDDDLDLSGANRLRPSTMGISFLTELPRHAHIVVEASCARYEQIKAIAGSLERAWWLRHPIAITATFEADAIRELDAGRATPKEMSVTDPGPIDVQVELYTRKGDDTDSALLTVCLVNRSKETDSLNDHSLFQCTFSVRIEPKDSHGHILPYPKPTTSPASLDDEEGSLDLLYREFRTYAVGHGCAADWILPKGQVKATAVSAENLPQFETPSITPEILRPDGSPLEVPMATLAGLDKTRDGFAEMSELVKLYEKWIERQDIETASLAAEYRPAAARHILDCQRALDRMKEGLAYLQADKQALFAFRLANKAVLMQQLRNRREPRKISYSQKEKRIKFSEPPPEANLAAIPVGKGQWRPFQIAFLLQAVKSCAVPQDPDRETVELIWFPTGGGKTEAYLGLAAFCAFLRRLREKKDLGVTILMRYTLRLLTAQQFQRASALICAMEAIRLARDQSQDLGETPFSIGIWLGSDNTPNSRSTAITSLNKLLKEGMRADNGFVVTQCPWCGAEMGPVEAKIPKIKCVGYERSGNTVILRCTDRSCSFYEKLPIYVIDEDIYEVRPTLLIGTVDKFAMLAWKEEARSIFGISPNGKRICSPPDLIIQDELHLISGPLGSMVGLYEALIEELCTKRTDPVVRPKIVSSTATIRRYREQIRSLYGRGNVALFPPPGLSTADSFFASYARDKDGGLLPGRVYVGVHAPGLGSMQTVQVRSFSALLQSVMRLPEDQRDPWWTLLLFFNSLRELGTTVSLFQSDIPDYFKVMRNRMGLAFDGLRRIFRDFELTSRLRNDEVPRAIKDLERIYNATDNHAIDVCLASNIIEVGIDIDRLSLMSVVGQPKSTSQYIQVTGRVGRKWWERPGVVITLYGASKPRDRSHFEQFRSYHERLYAQVEPTSVTPFSPPALDRALHGVMVGYVRQLADRDICRSPYPVPEDMLKELKQLLVDRANTVDPTERQTIETVFSKRLRQWKQWERTEWVATSGSENAPLLVMAGGYVPPDWSLVTWQTQTSMRNVDAECRVAITKLFLNGDTQ